MVTRIEIDDAQRPGDRRHLRPGRRRALPARRRGRRLRLRDRDAAAAAQLGVPAPPERDRQQRRPGRPLRDGAGRDADRRALPGAAADVQGAAARDLLGAVLRDRRAARLRARLLDPDDLPAADRLGRARARRGPLGPVAARVHARLQPLDGARHPRRVPAAAREPRHARRRDRPARHAGRALQLLHLRQRQGDRLVREEHPRRDLGRRRRAGHADDRPLRAPRRRRAHGLQPDDSVVDSSHRVWDVDNLFVVDGSVLPTQGSANPALAIMALADRCAEPADERLEPTRPARAAARRAALRRAPGSRTP